MRPAILLILLISFKIAISQKNDCDFSINTRNKNYTVLIDSLHNAHFRTTNKKRFLPKFIKRTLDCWTDKFDIANPGHKYQSTDIIHWRLKPLPIRQLTFLALNEQFLIIAYKKGGRGASEYLLIFKYENEIISDYWATTIANVKSVEEVINYLKYYSDLLDMNTLNF